MTLATLPPAAQTHVKHSVMAFLAATRGHTATTRAPLRIELTEADRQAAAQVCADALLPEPLLSDDVDLATARARVAAERQAKITAARREHIQHVNDGRPLVLTRHEVVAVMAGRAWLHVAEVNDLLTAAGRVVSLSVVKRRLVDATDAGLAERRGRRPTDVMYRAAQATEDGTP
jgi:hypothetical protein